MKPKKDKALRMKQIACGQFINADGSGSYSTVGLATDGTVWRFDPQCQGWIAWPMKPVGNSCAGHRR